MRTIEDADIDGQKFTDYGKRGCCLGKGRMGGCETGLFKFSALLLLLFFK